PEDRLVEGAFMHPSEHAGSVEGWSEVVPRQLAAGREMDSAVWLPLSGTAGRLQDRSGTVPSALARPPRTGNLVVPLLLVVVSVRTLHADVQRGAAHRFSGVGVDLAGGVATQARPRLLEPAVPSHLEGHVN